MAKRKAKLPAFQFYPGDWMKDQNLRRSSHGAKGLWIDLMCLMFESEERGVLATNGQPWTDDEIAWAAGGDRTTTLNLLSELIAKGVAARRQDGALFSRRMVRDESKRRKCSEAGKLGGNPTLKGHSKGAVKGHVKPEITPSSSSSSSSSDFSLPLADGVYEFPDRWRDPAFMEACRKWVSHILAQGKTYGRYQVEGLIMSHQSAGWTAERLTRGIYLSLGKATSTTIVDPDERSNGHPGPKETADDVYPNRPRPERRRPA